MALETRDKIALALASVPAGALMVPGMAFAEDGTPASAATLVSSVATDFVSQAQGVITTVIPVMVPLIGLGLAIRYGFKFVQNLSGRTKS